VSTIGVFSVKGSPGATTLALALAAHGREQGAVLIEADAAGGDLALRFGIPQAPGLAQFAARARQSSGRRDVLEGLVRTVDSDGANLVDLLPAPVEPAAVQAAVTALAANPEALAEAGKARPLVLDLGRQGPQPPDLGLLAACDEAVLVVRGNVVSLGHAREAGWLRQLPVRCGFVLVDTGPYRADEASDVLGLPCLASVPFSGRPLRGRRARGAVRALWAGLTEPAREQIHATELVEVNLNDSVKQLG
jgi:Mrp family chromosome partitioning ATPase